MSKNPLGPGFARAGAHSYAKVGMYTVTLTITDQGGSLLIQGVPMSIFKEDQGGT